MPRVSVVLPAYDQPEFLRDAVRTVAAQTMADLELVVVDDGSPTDLRPAFDDAAGGDPRLRYLRQDNAGGSAARNRGVAEARGEWIAFLDHDDLWEPDKLQVQLDAAAAAAAAADGADGGGAPGPGLVFCRFDGFRDGERPDGRGFPDEAPSGQVLRALVERTLIRTLSVVLVRRNALRPGETWFRSDLAISNDVELYYRIAARHPVLFVPRILVHKRIHDANASSDHLQLHLYAARIARELRAGSDGLDPALAAALRRRILRHLLGAGRAARRRGERRRALGLYREALAERSTSLRAWTGLLAAAVGR